jgi:hypothetical protein
MFSRETLELIEVWINWSGREDLNFRPLAPQASALTRLRHVPTVAQTYHLSAELSSRVFTWANSYLIENSNERAIETLSCLLHFADAKGFHFAMEVASFDPDLLGCEGNIPGAFFEPADEILALK